jgi:hypothetical protein
LRHFPNRRWFACRNWSCNGFKPLLYVYSSTTLKLVDVIATVTKLSQTCIF